tara:strand:+ start:1316 stop:1555 length:240 start_codon:yes stop_codon:yes gene_type:complete
MGKLLPKAPQRRRQAHSLSQKVCLKVSSLTCLSSLARGLKSPTLKEVDEPHEVLDIHHIGFLTFIILMKTLDNIIFSKE